MNVFAKIPGDGSTDVVIMMMMMAMIMIMMIIIMIMKGYILRGKITDPSGLAKLSFELEVVR